jgi:hypothetical protein
LKVFEFDGNYQQDLMALSGGHLPFFDRDYDRLFTLSPSTTVQNKPAFIQSYMRTTSDR